MLGDNIVFNWCPNSLYLAACGSLNKVHVYNRTGELVHSFSLPDSRKCEAVEWDKDGEILAVLQENASAVPLWRASDRKDFKALETNLKEISFISWSKTGPFLAIATAKGQLLIYNSRTGRLGVPWSKHSKKINCGGWSTNNQLVLSGLDKKLTVTNEEGDSKIESKLADVASQLAFSQNNDADIKSNDGTFCAVSNEGLSFINTATPEKPLQISFDADHGKVVRFQWIRDSFALVGFSKGAIQIFANSEVKDENRKLQCHPSVLYDLAYCAKLKKAAVAGNEGLKLIDMSGEEWKEQTALQQRFPKNVNPVSVRFSDDGMILTAATNNGILTSYLTMFTVMNASHGTNLCYLSGLRSVTIVSDTVQSVPVCLEPGFVALGPKHLAVGMNNHAFIYTLADVKKAPIPRNYVGSVQSMTMNDSHCAVLCGGICTLHSIDQAEDFKQRPTDDAEGDEEVNNRSLVKQDFTFPEEEDSKATAVALTPDFLIYATSKGSIHHFYLREGQQVSEMRHSKGIKLIAPNETGTRIVVVDDSDRGWLFTSSAHDPVEIPGFPSSATKVIWDGADRAVFVVVDKKNTKASRVRLLTYIVCMGSIASPLEPMVRLVKAGEGPSDSSVFEISFICSIFYDTFFVFLVYFWSL